MARSIPTVVGYGVVLALVAARSYRSLGGEQTLAFVGGAVFGFVLAVGLYHYHR